MIGGVRCFNNTDYTRYRWLKISIFCLTDEQSVLISRSSFARLPKKISPSTTKTCMRMLNLWRSCIIPEWHCTNDYWDHHKAMIKSNLLQCCELSCQCRPQMIECQDSYLCLRVPVDPSLFGYRLLAWRVVCLDKTATNVMMTP